MLDSDKDLLTAEQDTKGAPSKEIQVREFKEMEVELSKLKKVLATEIKLKEFLLKEIDFKRFLSNKSVRNEATDAINVDEVEAQSDINEINPKHQSMDDVREKTDQATSNKITPKRDLPAHDFLLIETLSAEHKQIRFVFNRLMSFAIERDYPKAAGQLEFFNQLIREHYQKTDTKLYSYLRTYVKIKYPKREKAFAQLSLEMKNISIEIFYIISQSPNIPLTEKTYDAFMVEFLAVGKLMNERINREKELLFKMYEQTNAVKSIS